MSKKMTKEELQELQKEFPELLNVKVDGRNDYQMVDKATNYELDNQFIWDIVKALKPQRRSRGSRRTRSTG